MELTKKDLVFGIMYIVLGKQIHLWLCGKGVSVRHINHRPGDCRVLPHLQCGSEKISVTSDGLAFITNGLADSTNCNKQFLRGNLYLFDFNNPDQDATRLQMTNVSKEFLESFDPHGMDVFEVNGIVKLYVVNHLADYDSIEVFHYSSDHPTEVQHVSTIRNELFHCLNDITIINEDEFYVTNFVKFFCLRSKFKYLSTFEVIFPVNTANIVFYKNGFSSIAAYGAVLNGLAQSPDKKFVYSASSSTSTVVVYERQKEGQLKRVKQIEVGYAPDNVHVDRQGHIYAGIQKNFFGMGPLLMNRTDHTSASAIKIEVPDDYNWRNVRVNEILHDDGKDFVHVVSSAVFFNDHYLFGTVFHKLAYCKGEGAK